MRTLRLLSLGQYPTPDPSVDGWVVDCCVGHRSRTSQEPVEQGIDMPIHIRTVSLCWRTYSRPYTRSLHVNVLNVTRPTSSSLNYFLSVHSILPLQSYA